MDTMETVEIDPIGKILEIEDPLELYLELESCQKSLNQAEKQVKEDQAIVLDFLPNGYISDRRPSHKKTAIVQALDGTPV